MQNFVTKNCMVIFLKTKKIIKINFTMLAFWYKKSEWFIFIVYNLDVFNLYNFL